MRWLNWILVGLLLGCAGQQVQEQYRKALVTRADAKAIALLDKHPELVDGRGSLRETNLQLAIAYERFEVARKLLEMGAPLETDPETRADLSVSGGAPLILLSLRQVNSEPSRHPARNLALQLLDKGAPVGAQDSRGFTALHHAVGLNDVELVEALLDGGASWDVKNVDGKSPSDLVHSPEMEAVLAR